MLRVCPLIFSPSIRSPITNPSNPISTIKPALLSLSKFYSYIMTEAYDWLLEAKLDCFHQAVSQIPTQDLGYPRQIELLIYLDLYRPSIAYIYGFDRNKPYRT